MRILKTLSYKFIEAYGRNIITTSKCLVCGRKLRRNNINQVVLYCSKRCRKARHNKKKNESN